MIANTRFTLAELRIRSKRYAIATEEIE